MTPSPSPASSPVHTSNHSVKTIRSWHIGKDGKEEEAEAERLVSDIQKVLKELEELPPRVSTKAAHVSVVTDETQSGNAYQTYLKKSAVETQKEIVDYSRRISDKKTSGVC